jgi:glycosyltransferase involved in cell wall biosynthesis
MSFNNKKIKVAFVCQPFYETSFPQPGDSIGIITVKLINYLRSDFNITVYSATEKSIWWKTQIDQGVLYQYIPTKLDSIFFYHVLKKIPAWLTLKKPWFSSILFYFLYPLQISIDLKRKQYDIVHIHNFSQFIPLIRLLNPQIKIVLHMHCEWLTQLDHSQIQSRLQLTDLIISCSDYLTNLIRNEFPEFQDRCQTLFNAVDIHKFVNQTPKTYSQSIEHPKLLFVGRISPEKGVHVLLDALKEVVKFYPNVQLNIVGPEGSTPKEYIVDLSDSPELKELARFYTTSYSTCLRHQITPEIANNICFKGLVLHDQIMKYFEEADIVINPSLSESFGMSLVEAMATETPVIASRIGGMQDVIEDGKTGVLIEPNNPATLAKAIIELLANPESRQFMGKTGRQRVMKLFCWDQVSSNLASKYQQIYQLKSDKPIAKSKFRLNN